MGALTNRLISKSGKYLEPVIHLLFWVFILSSINIDWTENWFDASLRPNRPAPLSLLLFAIYFYLNAYVLIPRYFSVKTWQQYAGFALLLFLLPELLRILFYQLTGLETEVGTALFSRDSFLFGTPSPFFLALNASFLYAFFRDRFFKRKRSDAVVRQAATKPYEGQELLDAKEQTRLQAAILSQLTEEQIYLNPQLSLRIMAEAVNSTEKKVSYLINQHLETNFFELLNKYRVDRFKAEIVKPENQHLSIVGIAMNCGFPSKSSFYRAFKSQVGVAPSVYIKKRKADQA